MSIKFADLNLDKNILSAVSSEGYESPTPIQAQAIPFALEGRDIMASAQTGFPAKPPPFCYRLCKN